jgi:hypothetical protein
VQAVVKGDGLEPVVHHTFYDLPYRLEEADAAVVAAAFGDEDSDDPPKLGGYLAFISHGLNEL